MMRLKKRRAMWGRVENEREYPNSRSLLQGRGNQKMHPLARRNAPPRTESTFRNPNKIRGLARVENPKTIKTIKSYRRSRLLTRRLFCAFSDKPEGKESLMKKENQTNTPARRLGVSRSAAAMPLIAARRGVGRLGGFGTGIHTLQALGSLRWLLAPIQAQGVAV